jgi:hypothetical protein
VDLIVFVAVLSCVAVLAMRFGYDSRMPAPSKEHDLANFGLSWQDQPGTTAGDPSRETALFPCGPSTQNARPRLVMLKPFFGTLRKLVG